MFRVTIRELVLLTLVVGSHCRTHLPSDSFRRQAAEIG